MISMQEQEFSLDTSRFIFCKLNIFIKWWPIIFASLFSDVINKYVCQNPSLLFPQFSSSVPVYQSMQQQPSFRISFPFGEAQRTKTDAALE